MLEGPVRLGNPHPWFMLHFPPEDRASVGSCILGFCDLLMDGTVPHTLAVGALLGGVCDEGKEHLPP